MPYFQSEHEMVGTSECDVLASWVDELYLKSTSRGSDPCLTTWGVTHRFSVQCMSAKGYLWEEIFLYRYSLGLSSPQNRSCERACSTCRSAIRH